MGAGHALAARRRCGQAAVDANPQKHVSASEATRIYDIVGINSWEQLSGTTAWPTLPANKAKALDDAEEMFTAIADQWYGLHHDLIKNHERTASYQAAINALCPIQARLQKIP